MEILWSQSKIWLVKDSHYICVLGDTPWEYKLKTLAEA